MAQDINTIAITGNLTADPELRNTNSGTPVCKMRVASNGRKKEGDNWVDDANFFDVIVWGAQGQAVANNLGRGRKVGVQGRLNHREYEHEGQRRQVVEIVADNVSFLDPPQQAQQQGQVTQSQANPAGGQAAAAPTSPADDIPF